MAQAAGRGSISDGSTSTAARMIWRPRANRSAAVPRIVVVSTFTASRCTGGRTSTPAMCLTGTYRPGARKV